MATYAGSKQAELAGLLARYVLLTFRINRILKTADMNGQVCNFLNHLAFKADLDDLTPKGYPARNKAFAGSDYEPMRRKMNIVRS